MKHSQRNASHGRLAHHNRSTSAIKLHGGQLQGGPSNFAVTAFKAREELVKRSESSNTIRLDHTSGNKAAGFHVRDCIAVCKPVADFGCLVTRYRDVDTWGPESRATANQITSGRLSSS